ncbi:MAG: WYL domain-containing protein [Oscillospiraceae bacterium]|nr:WYL domain-containing protein [Oscillospiraceae bacterium]
MPSAPNQRLKLLYLMKILLERTDEETPFTMAQVISALAEYGIQAERKSLYNDMELLRQFGLDVQTCKSKSVGYYIGGREFELPELKLLVDAVQSSRFITAKKSGQLIQKLSALTSVQQAKRLNRQVVTAQLPKPLNESIYYSIDAIHEAIGGRRKICFQYFDYDTKKKRVYRRGGEAYSQTPVALCWSDDKYYLICFSAKYDGFAHYRVDRMSHVTVSEVPGDSFDRTQFHVGEYTKRLFGMFGGTQMTAKLRFDQSLVNAVLDQFGADLPLYQTGEHFEVTVEVSNSPVFLSWVFQFGHRAEILAPAELRASMATLLSEHINLYR